MKKLNTTLVLVAMPALIFSGTLVAEERGRGGEMRGTFVRLVEQQVGAQGHLGVVIRPFESDDHVTVLVPQKNEDLRLAARQLREGQTLGIAFANEGRNNWVRRLETGPPRDPDEERPERTRERIIERQVRRDPRPHEDLPQPGRGGRFRSDEERERFLARRQRQPERPLPRLEQVQEELRDVVTGQMERMGRAVREVLGAHIERMQAELRELRAHAERMEREMHDLRAENERLRMQLRERAELRMEREREIRERAEAEHRRENREAEERELLRDRDQRGEPSPSPR